MGCPSTIQRQISSRVQFIWSTEFYLLQQFSSPVQEILFRRVICYFLREFANVVYYYYLHNFWSQRHFSREQQSLQHIIDCLTFLHMKTTVSMEEEFLNLRPPHNDDNSSPFHRPPLLLPLQIVSRRGPLKFFYFNFLHKKAKTGWKKTTLVILYHRKIYIDQLSPPLITPLPPPTTSFSLRHYYFTIK